MGTNCVPSMADLFLYSYKNEFLDELVKEGKRKLARKFNLSYRYTDDLISFNINKSFKEFISDIYPKEVTISETTESTSVASCLDLLFTGDQNSHITTKLYDKHDVNFSLKRRMFYKTFVICAALRTQFISDSSALIRRYSKLNNEKTPQF